MPLELTPPRERSPWPESWSIGEYVDEGYKTLDARNQTLFGSTHWNAGDDYVGWTARSPLTHWPYRAAFALFGAEAASARGVTIVYFAALLAAFAAAMRRRQAPGLVLLGLLLLGTQHSVFFFSRAALFEVPLALCLYGFLFLLARGGRVPAGPPMAAFLVALAVATFGIKGSSPAYFAPVAVGLLVAANAHRMRRLLAAAALLAIPLGICAWCFRSLWALRVDFDVLDIPRRLVTGTLMHSTAPLAALGLACAFHALWVEPRRYIQDPYRASLLALVVLGPISVGLFSHRPLRYYVPLIPAYVLLGVEWIHLRSWRSALPERTAPAAVPLLLALLTWALFSIGVAVHRHVLEPFVPGWELDGVPRAGLAGALALAGAAAWRARRLTGRATLTAILALLTLSSARDFAVLRRFLVAPAHQARAIADALQERLPPGSTIAGDWAPFLALGTPFPALYSNPGINPIGRFTELRPDYYLFAEGYPWAHFGLQDPRAEIEANGWLELPAVLEAQYAGREVFVYRLEYD